MSACRLPLQADDTHSLVPPFSFGSTSTAVDVGGGNEKIEEESKFNQNKKTTPKPPEDNKKKEKELQPKKEESTQKKKEDHPVLDEFGTTYDDIIRRIEQMNAEDFENSTDYEVVNLSSVKIPDEFISGGMAESEVYRDDEEPDYIEPTLTEVILPESDDDTVQVNNVSAKEAPQYFEYPRAQIDGGAKSSVTNLLQILHDVKWYDNKFKCPVYMRGATSKKLIIPRAIGKLRVQANTRTGWLDCDCYYHPDFTSTLLSERDVRRASGFPKQYGQQVLAKSFAVDEEAIVKDLSTGKTIDHDNAA